MKLAACLIIVALSAYIGRLLSKRAAQRLDFFREYQAAFVYLSDRIVGLNLELVKALEAPYDSALHRFFKDCSVMLKNSPQTRFTGIWEKCMEKYVLTFLSKEDLNFVLNGGGAVENLCMNPSEKQSATYLKRLAAYVEQIEADKRKKCKLYNTSGVLAGLFIALMII